MSEGVAYGEVEGEGFFEGRHVVVAAAAGVVGGVDAYAKVGPDDEDADVETQACSGAEGKVAQEWSGTQGATGAQGVVFEQPHVSGVEEYGSVERAEDGEA